MSKVKVFAAAGMATAVTMASGPATVDGDAERGRKVFRQCAAHQCLEKRRIVS